MPASPFLSEPVPIPYLPRRHSRGERKHTFWPALSEHVTKDQGHLPSQAQGFLPMNQC